MVGLATARQALLKYPNSKVIVFEKEDDVATHQSRRNSGIIHSGIYYKPNGLKAKNCFNGRLLLQKFCEEHNIPFKICGKLIVANRNEDLPVLEQLMNNAPANHLEGVTYLSKEQVKEREPYVCAIKALWVPQTGIIDFLQLAQKLAQQIKEKGGEVHLQEKVTGLQKMGKKQVNVRTLQGEYCVNVVINCGGLYSDHIGRWTEKKLETRIIPFRGEYYRLVEDRAKLINHIVYSTPDTRYPFLGAHFHRNIYNRVEVGPRAVWAFKREGYHLMDIDIKNCLGDICWPGFIKLTAQHWDTGLKEIIRSISKTAFLKEAQKMIPSLQAKDLVRSRSGVRAQACDRQGNLVDDFRILQNGQIIHVCNAPSPGATSCLSIGKTIADSIHSN